MHPKAPPITTSVTTTCGEGVSDIPAATWDALVDPNDPFLEHAFLAALERSGSVGQVSGWIPRFVLARRGADLVGAVPLYLKFNSYGEFIFDWAWANAAHRAGLRYYPKLVAAIPFTPVTGSRLLVHPEDPAPDTVRDALIAAVGGFAQEVNASSVHVLFCTEAESTALAAAGYAPRLSMQFHWHNRHPVAYQSFDDFLGEFRSRNRKQVRKERSIAAGHGLRLETRTGRELTPRDWAALEGFYQSNVDKHDGTAYLTPEFFEEMRHTFAHRVVATLAYRGEEPVAGTFNFERGRHLYGRYWGCTEEREMMHFELCYYRLIDRAIALGCTRFEAGAQGEHKLKRGLVPSATHSAHLMRHPALARAVEDFVRAEADGVRAQMAHYEELSPFSRGEI